MAGGADARRENNLNSMELIGNMNSQTVSSLNGKLTIEGRIS